MNNLKELISQCISEYIKYDYFIQQYTLHIDDIPDFIQHELVSCLIAQDAHSAQEATGNDNSQYLSKMLPTLINLLKHSTSQDEEIEFVRAWKEGVTFYYKDKLQHLLDDAIYSYNEEGGLLLTNKPYIPYKQLDEVYKNV